LFSAQALAACAELANASVVKERAAAPRSLEKCISLFPGLLSARLHYPGARRYRKVVLGALIQPVEQVGWDGDALEAQAFAYLAVRSLRGLPLSYPGTTGVPAPQTGGVVARP